MGTHRSWRDAPAAATAAATAVPASATAGGTSAPVPGGCAPPVPAAAPAAGAASGRIPAVLGDLCDLVSGPAAMAVQQCLALPSPHQQGCRLQESAHFAYCSNRLLVECEGLHNQRGWVLGFEHKNLLMTLVVTMTRAARGLHWCSQSRRKLCAVYFVPLTSSQSRTSHVS